LTLAHGLQIDRAGDMLTGQLFKSLGIGAAKGGQQGQTDSGTHTQNPDHHKQVGPSLNVGTAASS
jgi:hypothetical protein